MSQQSTTSPQLFLLEGQADFQEQAIKIAAQARRSIAILSRDLDADIFGTPEFVAAISEFARSNRNTQIQIIVKNTKPLVESIHHLVRLSQRLPSKINLRKLVVEPDNTDMGFMLCDSNTLLYKNDEEFYKGFVNFEAIVEVKRLRETFDYIWQYAETEPELQPLSI